MAGTIQIPSSMTITAITNAFPAVITVSVNPITESLTYVPGQNIRLNVPINYGMYQANGLTPQITAVNGLQITVNLDTTLFDPFVVPNPLTYGPATLSPNGSRNLTLNNTTAQVPFQSLNNRGN